MTFFQARALSKTGFFHVRRDGWATDRWFIVWRGVWFYFATGILRVVEAGDYSAADLLATDWTTVPAPLTSCPVVPPTGGDPGSPGGLPPGPLFPGYPPDPPGPPYAPGPGGGGGGGGGSGSGIPPASTGGFTVTFDGLVETNPDPPTPKEVSDTASTLNGNPFLLRRTDTNTWKASKTAGTYGPGTGGVNLPILWEAEVSCPDYGDPSHIPYHFFVSLSWKNTFGGLGSIGGFQTIVPGEVGSPIDNNIPAGTLNLGGGTATLSNG